jgi:hypothetical protein
VGARVSLPPQDAGEARLYPRAALEGMSTAFMGFCAGFLGRQDCVWVAEAGLDATCVDLDAPKLKEMRDMYPDGWVFVEADVFDYARQRYAQGARFDVVNLDPPTNLFERAADTIGLWCGLARSVVILGIGRHTSLGIPDGWKVRDVRRRSTFAGGTYWTTLEKQ